MREFIAVMFVGVELCAQYRSIHKYYQFQPYILCRHYFENGYYLGPNTIHVGHVIYNTTRKMRTSCKDTEYSIQCKPILTLVTGEELAVVPESSNVDDCHTVSICFVLHSQSAHIKYAFLISNLAFAVLLVYVGYTLRWR